MTESNTDMDIQPTQADAWTSPNISDTNIAIDHEDKLGTVLQAEPSLCPMMQGGDVKADGTGGRNSELSSRDCGSAFSFTPDEELSHVQAMATPWGDRVDRTPICAHSSNDPSPVSCPMTTEEETFPVPSPIADVRCSGGIPTDNHALVMLRGHVELAKYTPNLEALSLHASVASVVMEPGARETCSTDNSNHVQISRTVLNNLEDNTRLAYYNHAHQEAIPEDLDCFGEDFPSSSAPPASSPPQLFHSSPFASSQSSISVDDEIQKKEKVTFEEEDRTHRDGSKAEDEMTIPLHSEDEHCRDPSGEIRTDMATSPDIDHSLVTLDLLGGTVDGPRSVDGHLGKRPLLEDHDLTLCMRTDEMRAPHLPPPSKRARTKAKVYLPPAPKRATIASQRRQFKKLIAPFRSPLRLPPAVDGPSQVANNRDLEPTIIPEREWSRADPDRKESDKHLTTSQRKSAVPKTLRAAAQFKSPLIDSGATLTDCRGTIRLTPTIQTLERKLQLLKRAVQVKENNEDEILSRVAKKWTEAAREVAYEVWGIIGDSANIVDGAKSFGGSWGWDGDDNRDAKWGWDTKIEDTSGELGNYDLPEAPDSTKRLALEEEVDERASLATMLRQLGITPETLGWDNDRETFLD